MNPTSRRTFLSSATATGAMLSLGDLAFLGRLPEVSAADAKLNPKLVALRPEIEPLVRLLEDSPRERLLEEAAARVKRGTTYNELLTAVMLAGVRNIQPRPVGFKFHAVLVINSAHLAAQAASDADRWLPLFWSLDQFKVSQARNKAEGDWRMGPVEESKVPSAHKARAAFAEAMDNWDTSAADAAVAGLARGAGANEIFELFCRYGARDFRDIGHKAIYVANSWRCLNTIGWQHAEPVLRSLAFALLDHEQGNPAERDADADRPGRRNAELVKSIRADWLAGKPDTAATTELLAAFRQCSDAEAAQKVVEALNRGVAPSSVWDAVLLGASELLMRAPAIRSLHSVTTANALHYAFTASANDETRRFLLLQAASFLPLFRGDAAKNRGVDIDTFEAAPLKSPGAGAVDEICADVGGDKLGASRKILTWMKANPDPRELMAAARRLIFLKGRDSHDYKFSSAALEDFFHCSPAWRNRFLAASVFWLKGSGAPDNDLVKRTRAALGA